MNASAVPPEAWYQTKEVIGAITGAAVAFFVVVAYDLLRSRRRRRAHFAALRAELEYCRTLADTYLRDQIAAPLYRLPTHAYSASFPALLADAALSEAETSKLLQFFVEVETLNRGLEQAEEARLIDNEVLRDEKLKAEYGRNRLKAERLVPLNALTQSYYGHARAALDARLRWYRLLA
jgi:hypothetical protein